MKTSVEFNRASLPVAWSGAVEVVALAVLSRILLLGVFPQIALANSIQTKPVIAAYRAVCVHATPAVIRQSRFCVRLTPAPNIRCAAHALAAQQGSSATALGAVFLFVLGAVTLAWWGGKEPWANETKHEHKLSLYNSHVQLELKQKMQDVSLVSQQHLCSRWLEGGASSLCLSFMHCVIFSPTLLLVHRRRSQMVLR